MKKILSVWITRHSLKWHRMSRYSSKWIPLISKCSSQPHIIKAICIGDSNLQWWGSLRSLQETSKWTSLDTCLLMTIMKKRTSWTSRSTTIKSVRLSTRATKTSKESLTKTQTSTPLFLEMDSAWETVFFTTRCRSWLLGRCRCTHR